MARGVQLLERNSNEQTVVNTRREGDQGCSGNGEYCGGEGEGGGGGGVGLLPFLNWSKPPAVTDREHVTF